MQTLESQPNNPGPQYQIDTTSNDDSDEYDKELQKKFMMK